MRALLEALAAATLEEDARPSWQARGSCSKTDPDLFFPAMGGSVRNAKKVCAGCPVKSECLEDAMAVDEEHGVWGGLSRTERRALARLRSQEAS